MDLNIYWSPGSSANIADGFNVFYKEYDPLGLNTWILANPTLLPYTATSYTITGLDANTVYRVMIAKSCLGIQDVLVESTVVNSGCPIVATWQGPMVNNYPTLFYSVYYPDGIHMGNARVALYDTQVNDSLPTSCPTPADLVVGRTTYITTNFCSNFTTLYCGEQQLDFLSPSNASSALSYLGKDTRNVFPGNTLASSCDSGLPITGGGLLPLLLKYNTDYKFNITPQIKYASEFFYQDSTCFWYAVDVTPFSFATNPAAPYPTLNVANIANISAAGCYDPSLLSIKLTNQDGTGRTDIINYSFNYEVYDTSLLGPFPYLKDNGLPETSNQIDFRVHGELVYTSSFATYISSDMDIDIDFTTNVPSTISVLSLTNQNYTGFTLIQFLSDLASKINTIGTYSAVVVPLGSGSYALRIYHSDVTIQSISFTYNGAANPIGLIGAPLLQENYSAGESGILSAFEYNGFIYGARLNDNIANIQATEIATGNTIGYSHPIDFLIAEIELVPVAPPTEVYDVKVLQTSTGSYPYNLAIDETNGYIYVINNTDITVYDLTTNAQLDTANLTSIIGSTRVYRHIGVIEDTGEILLFESPAGGPTAVDVIQYVSVGNWTYSTTYTYGESDPGDIKYNPVTRLVYLSVGNGQVIICTGTNIAATVQLLEPDGITNAVGAFQMTIDPITGMVYLTRRDSVSTSAAPSKHIYTIDSFNNPGVIDGSLYWNVDICGAISLSGDSLYFTARHTRTFIEFDKATLTQVGAKTIPSVYKKLATTGNSEYTQGAYIIGSNRFVVMNYVNTTNTLGTAADYQITDLFVYDYVNNVVVQTLIGGPNEPYSGLITGWNPNVDGPTFASNNVNINYAYSLSIKIASTGKIYWKGAINTPFLVSQSYTEGGVAQIWAIQALQGSKALIRIFNIQSDGTLEVSNRLICQNYTNAIRNMRYDSHYGGVIVNSYLGSILDIWDPTNLTGYVGNTIPISYPSSTYFTSVDYLGNGTTAGLYWAQRILSNNQGGIAIFGPRYPAFTNRYGYMNFAESDIKTQSIAPTFNSTGDAVNPGLYNTDSYPQMYVSATNTYWVAGRTLYFAGDEIINIYNASNSGPLTLLHTINLTAAGVAFSGFTLMTYLPSQDTVVIYGSIGKFYININTYAGILHIITLPVPGSGALVYTPTGNYLDYRLNSTQEAWTLFGFVPTTITTNTYQYLAVTYTDYASISNTDQYDLYANLSITSFTFGQWKEITDTTWATIPSTISTTLGATIEFTSFILDKPLVAIRNLTQSTTYPISNGLNAIKVYTIIADNINLFNGDLLEFEFTNPDNPSCPFINQSLIAF